MTFGWNASKKNSNDTGHGLPATIFCKQLTWEDKKSFCSRCSCYLKPLNLSGFFFFYKPFYF